jgi:hypothetical protein
MLGADIIVDHPLGFFGRVSQDSLRFGGKRDLNRGRNLVAYDDPPLDLFTDRLHRETGLGEDTAGEAFALSNEPQKKMLGLDGATPELSRLITGEEYYAFGSFGVSLEHVLHPNVMDVL